MVHWNEELTRAVRRSRPTFWGNWSLDPSVQPGAVGIVDPKTGSFRAVNKMPGAESETKDWGSSWNFTSEGTKEEQTEFNFTTGGKIPADGGEFELGLKVDWTFSEAKSIVSRFADVQETRILDWAALIQQRRSWLVEQAASVGMAPNGYIEQGFCFVVNVARASSGANVGAHSADSAFSLEGTAEGVSKMLGMSASGEASYSKKSSSASTEERLFPSSANETPSELIPIAYEVVSFSGDAVLTDWTGVVKDFSLNLHNTGTWIVKKGVLEYTSKGVAGKKSHGKVSGGTKGDIKSIPVDATNLLYTMEYNGKSGKDRFSWTSTLHQWESSQKKIKLTTAYPANPNPKEQN